MADDNVVVRKMLTIDDVLDIVPFGRSTLFAMEGEGRFPRGHLAGNRKFWFADQVREWQDTLPTSRVGNVGE